MTETSENIWHHITGYIPPGNVLINLCRDSFNVVMNERYKRVSFIPGDENYVSVIKTLHCLSNPDISQRVHTVCVRTSLFQDILDNAKKRHSLKHWLAPAFCMPPAPHLNDIILQPDKNSLEACNEFFIEPTTNVVYNLPQLAKAIDRMLRGPDFKKQFCAFLIFVGMFKYPRDDPWNRRLFWLKSLSPMAHRNHRRLTSKANKYVSEKCGEVLTLTSIIQAITNTILKLPKVKVFILTLDENSWESHPNDYMSSLTALWAYLAPNLIKLELNAMTYALRPLMEEWPGFGLVNLEALDITLIKRDRKATDSSVGQKDAEDRTALNDVLCPFISSLYNTLQSLSITTVEHLDFTLFFDRLEHIRQLSRLGIYIPLDKEHFSDISTFTRFLNKHRDTLQHLSIHPTICIRLSPIFLADSDTRFSHLWGVRCLSGVVLSNLCTLDLGAKPTMSGQLTEPDLCPSSSQDGNLEGHFALTLKDVIQILDPRSGCWHIPSAQLTELRLNVHVVTPELIKTIADNCPRLRKLNVKAGGAVHQEGERPSWIHSPPSSLQSSYGEFVPCSPQWNQYKKKLAETLAKYKLESWFRRISHSLYIKPIMKRL